MRASRWVWKTESSPKRNLEAGHMRGCWYRSGLPPSSSGSLFPCWSCWWDSWKPELLCRLMRLQLGDNRRKAQCEEAVEEEEKKEEEDYLSQPSGHNHISLNPSKVTVREVLVRGGPWAEAEGRGEWRVREPVPAGWEKRRRRVDFLTYWLVFIACACVIMWCKC